MTIRRTLTALATLALAALPTACGGGDDLSISDAPLSGSIGGEAWTFMSGETDAFLSEGDDDFFAVLSAGAELDCGFGQPDGNYLILAVPKTPGEYDLSLQRNMTFVVAPSDNLIGTDGVIRVDTVTDTTVTGGIHAVYDGDNEVDGTFELTVCVDDGA